MSTKIQGYMNVVGYLETVPQEGSRPRRVLRVWGTERFEAKDQFDAFSKGRLVDPTMNKFVGAIEKARQEQRRAHRRATSKRRKATKTRRS
jgi:hypothetical protein